MPKSCALTNERAAFGVRKPQGECTMTKLAFRAVDARTITAPPYTHCKKCGLSVCVSCWDCVALELEKLMASSRGIVMHDVYHVLLTGAYRTFTLSAVADFNAVMAVVASGFLVALFAS